MDRINKINRIGFWGGGLVCFGGVGLGGCVARRLGRSLAPPVLSGTRGVEIRIKIRVKTGGGELALQF